MLRKLSIATMLAFMLVILFTATAYACDKDEPDKDFATIVTQANASIEDEIEAAIDDANDALRYLNRKISCVNQMLKKGMISKHEADSRISNYQTAFGNQINAIASRLISRTDAIVFKLLREAKKRGVTVNCAYVEVNLAGRIYLVDPLVIVGN